MSDCPNNPPKNILKKVLIVFISICIIFFVYVFIMIYKHKKQINKNWAKYKCKPYIMPIAGMNILGVQIGPSSTSPSKTYAECTTASISNIFYVLFEPVIKIIDLIHDIISDIIYSIEHIREFINYLRSSMHNALVDIAGKIYDVYYRLAFLFRKLKRIFKSLIILFKDIFGMLFYLFGVMYSMWEGSIGGVARFFCFDKNTYILMKDNTHKRIDLIQPNDNLYTGKVLSIMKFSATGVDMYKYRDIIVSGSHLVYEKGKYIRVADSILSKKIKNYKENIIYCLDTSSSLININGTYFADYSETTNETINSQIQSIILNNINNTTNIKTSKCYSWCFSANTKIGTKYITELNIGDKINDNTIVIGIIKIANNNSINMYTYNNVIASGTTIVKYGNKWKQLSEIGKRISVKDKYYYNICTNNNIIEINGLLFRDFEQIRDESTNNYIDSLVINYLNHF